MPLPHCAIDYIASYGNYHMYHTVHCSDPDNIYGYGESMGPAPQPTNGCESVPGNCHPDSIVVPTFLPTNFLKTNERFHNILALLLQTLPSSLDSEALLKSARKELDAIPDWQTIVKVFNLLESLFSDVKGHFYRLPRKESQITRFLRKKDKLNGRNSVGNSRKNQLNDLDEDALYDILDMDEEEREKEIEKIERRLNSAVSEVYSDGSIGNQQLVATDFNFDLDYPVNSDAGSEISFDDLYEIGEKYRNNGSQDAVLHSGKHYIKLKDSSNQPFYFRLAELKLERKSDGADVELNVGFQVEEGDGFDKRDDVAPKGHVKEVDMLCHSHIVKVKSSSSHFKYFHLYSTDNLEDGFPE